MDYRLAPEHAFPAAVIDCAAATKWVHRQASAFRLDASRVAVGGDSAGGNPIRFQLLIYPGTEMRSTASSHRTNGQGYLLTSDSIDYFHNHYIADPAHDFDWRASPLLCDDLTRLPPAFVLTAGYDPLRDDGLVYSQPKRETASRTFASSARSTVF